MNDIEPRLFEPLVFFHGWGFDSHVWSAFNREFFSDRQTCAVDMPGYGVNQTHRGAQTLEELCQAVNEVIPSSVILVGWSLGGQAAIEFASLFPEKVKKLILISTSPCFIKKEDWVHGVDPNTVISMMQALRKNKEKTMMRFFTRLAMGAANENEDLIKLKEMKTNRPLTVNVLEAGLEMLLKEDQRKVFKVLKPPVYMCFGKGDSLVDAHLVGACKELNPGISTCLIDGAGHAPFLFAPKQTSDWIKQIMSGRLN